MQKENIGTPSCPACTAPRLSITSKGALNCRHCGTTFSGKPLICASCGWINSIQAEVCPDCGEPISIVAQVIRRHDTQGKPHWLERVQSQADLIKRTEEQASKERMQRFEQIDQRRNAAVVKEEKLRQIRDKKVLIVIAATLLVAFTLLIAFVFILGS